MKIGQLLRKLWSFSWPKVIPRTLKLWGVRLLGGCVYYAEYGISIHADVRAKGKILHLIASGLSAIQLRVLS